MNIFVVGFPYVRERYFDMFRHWPEPERIRFLLPARWPAKDGKVIFEAPQDPRITTTRTYFWHSHYPVIGGLLKGWMPYFPYYLWKNRKNTDLVYACAEPMLLSTLWFVAFSRLLGKKVVLFSWQNLSYRRRIHAILVRTNLFLVQGLICGNQAGVSIYRSYSQKPIAVIPMNGLDPERFKPNPEFRLHGELADKIVFTFVGAIGYRKGIHNILKALPRVLEEVPQTHVIIAGSGEYEPEIKGLIDEPFNRAHVTRFPWIDDHELIRILSITDVFLYPSIPYGGWTEQFGYSMAEALLMELPVIATLSGSIDEVVLDDKTGILVKPDDVGALADAMIRLGTDEGLRHRLGRAGRQYIMEHFSQDIVAHKFFDFFTSINAQNH